MSREPRIAERRHTDQGAGGPADPRPDGNEPIAIVGIGLRLPGGCESPDEFDAFLREGRSGIRSIPEERWDVEALRAEGPDDRRKITTGSGGFLDRIDLFDAPFFNISPKEARYIDPQQRMVPETAWQALEHATPSSTPMRPFGATTDQPLQPQKPRVTTQDRNAPGALACVCLGLSTKTPDSSANAASASQLKAAATDIAAERMGRRSVSPTMTPTG